MARPLVATAGESTDRQCDTKAYFLSEMWNFLALLPVGYQRYRYPEKRKRFVITGITAFVASTIFLLFLGAYVSLLLNLTSSLQKLHGTGTAQAQLSADDPASYMFVAARTRAEIAVIDSKTDALGRRIALPGIPSQILVLERGHRLVVGDAEAHQ